MERRSVRRGTRRRHDLLLSLLRQGTTRVEDLAEALSVSASTVRRDLGRLGAEHLVARTYGGAVVPESFHERPITDSARVRTVAKAAIAAAARELVPADGTIFLDAGTTCAALARILVEDADVGHLTVVTRGLETAMILTEASFVDTIILGGRVRPLSHGLVGPLTELGLDRLTFDVAFMGADAVDVHRGIGEPTLEETAVKERIATASRQTTVLADATKLREPAAPAWTRFEPGWLLITDAEAPDDLEDRAAAAGVAVIRAEPARPADESHASVS